MEKELSRQPSFRESSHPAPSTTRHPAFAMVFVELGGIKENVLASMTPIHGALSGQPPFGESLHPAPSTTRHPAFAMAFVKLGGLKRMSWHR